MEETMPPTLLEKARSLPVRHGKLGIPTTEEIELVIALLYGTVSWSQAAKVIGKATGSIDAFCSGTLRRAVRNGLTDIIIREQKKK